MPLQIVSLSKFTKKFDKLEPSVQQDVTEAINRLAIDPNPMTLPPEFKWKVIKNKAAIKKYGPIRAIHPYNHGYRLVYLVKANSLVLVVVDTRENFYREIERK